MAIEAFAGYTIRAEDIVALINSPRNALLMQYDTCRDYDTRFAWGIEAMSGSDHIVGPIPLHNWQTLSVHLIDSVLFPSRPSGIPQLPEPKQHG